MISLGLYISEGRDIRRLAGKKDHYLDHSAVTDSSCQKSTDVIQVLSAHNWQKLKVGVGVSLSKHYTKCNFYEYVKFGAIS